jgi:hypothetical protein
LEQRRALYLKEHYAWADVPANVDLLFNATLTLERIAKAKRAKDKQQWRTSRNSWSSSAG